jgi:hypothetical protein
MKVGDTFYFLDISLGKISKHKLFEESHLNDVECPHLHFSGVGKFRIGHIHFRYNCTPEDYAYSSISFWCSSKNFLVFTEVEDAQKCLIDYILPSKLEIHKKAADKLGKEFQKLLNKAERVEAEIKRNTEKSSQICNALKKKFV